METTQDFSDAYGFLQFLSEDNDLHLGELKRLVEQAEVDPASFAFLKSVYRHAADGPLTLQSFNSLLYFVVEVSPHVGTALKPELRQVAKRYVTRQRRGAVLDWVDKKLADGALL